MWLRTFCHLRAFEDLMHPWVLMKNLLVVLYHLMRLYLKFQLPLQKYLQNYINLIINFQCMLLIFTVMHRSKMDNY